MDVAGQHDLADAMERLALRAKLPFHLSTDLLGKIRGAAPEAFEEWVRTYKPKSGEAWDAAFDLARVHPEYRTVLMPDDFYSWAKRFHPDLHRNAGDDVQRQMHDIVSEMNEWRTGQMRNPDWMRQKGFDPNRGFIPTKNKYDVAPEWFSRTPPPPPPRPPRPGPAQPPPSGATTPPGPGPTTPPPSPPPPGPGPAGPPPSGPRTPPPGSTVPPPTPRPTPSVSEPNEGLWQNIPWWVKWPAVGYAGYRTFWPNPPRAPRQNVTPPEQVLTDPRQTFEDRPYNPYYQRKERS